MKKEKFRVFGDEALGRFFIPNGVNYDSAEAFIFSPLHGRAVAMQIEEYKWLNIKGGGWNYGGPQIYISKKDEELVFGLYPLDSAVREFAVSKEIEKISTDFSKVLYYKNICDYTLPKKYDFLKTIKFKNGQLVSPCILYTQLKCPLRVADLIYFNNAERNKAIEYCCKYWNIDARYYSKTFIQTLAKNVAILHKHGFINDTLDYGNVTMLGEIVDYEWVTAPNIKLLDGTDGCSVLTEERKEKEILYGVEVCLQLKAMLYEEYNFFNIYESFVYEYSKINCDFINKNERIRLMLNKERFIL